MIGEKFLISYVAGYALGDGHLEPGNNRIILFSSNEVFAEKLCKILHKLDYRYSKFWDKGANEWKIAIRSKKLREILTGRYGIPPGNKARAKIVLGVAEEEIESFLAGIFDAEGWLELDKNKYTRIRLKMMNEFVVSFVYTKLQSMHIEARSHKRTDGSFVVEVNKQRDIKSFREKIMLLHPKWRQFYGYL